MREISTTNRLTSADVYRGFVMLLMMAEVLRFHRVAEALPDSSFWKFMAHHQDHVDWVGCSLHDLIQPSFSFLVGVVLPYSIANRLGQGGFGKLFGHALWRSLVLILLGIFLRSQGEKQTYFTFEDTLTQIGLGYPLLFLLGFRSVRTQIMALITILVGYWLAFVLYPLPESNLDFAAHWNKNTNLAWAFDTWFLNLFPREKPFLFNGGGYTTLSFIPTLGTMILGLMAGNILKSEKPPKEKLKTFILLGICGLAIGFALNFLGICPNVKRIWTPTWVIFSGGWCFLLMAFFYWIVDLKESFVRTQTKATQTIAKWSFFLVVIGMNSIAAYIFAHTIDSYISKALFTHLGEKYHEIFGIPYKTLVHGFLILLFEWLILWWMYRKKIFIRV